MSQMGQHVMAKLIQQMMDGRDALKALKDKTSNPAGAKEDRDMLEGVEKAIKVMGKTFTVVRRNHKPKRRR